MEEVVDTTRQQLAADDLNYASLTAGLDTEATIWAVANQYPLSTGASRLTVIRDADKLKKWDALTLWAGNLRTMPGSHLLFVSAEPDFPYTGDGKRGTLKPHVELIKNKGRIVRCAMPNEPDAIAWVRRRCPLLDDDTAQYLLTRAGGSLSITVNVAAKLSLFTNVVVTTATIDLLVEERSGLSFVDALLHDDKRAAVTLAPSLDRAERSRVTALLDSRLDLLGQLWNTVRAGQGLRDVTGVNPFLARLYLPVAKHYSPQRCAYSRRLLAVVDDAHRRGADEGVMEALVALF